MKCLQTLALLCKQSSYSSYSDKFLLKPICILQVREVAVPGLKRRGSSLHLHSETTRQELYPSYNLLHWSVWSWKEDLEGFFLCQLSTWCLRLTGDLSFRNLWLLSFFFSSTIQVAFAIFQSSIKFESCQDQMWFTTALRVQMKCKSERREELFVN